MILRYSDLVVSHIEYIYLLVPLAIILLFLLKRKFIKEEQRLYKGGWRKRSIFLLRMLFFAALIIALSNPYIEQKENQSNVTKVKVLIDKSHSTELYDIRSVEKTLSSISEKGITTDIDTLEMEDYSSIGSAVLSNLAPNENILLVTDGQSNFGPDMTDVAIFASSINSRIFAVELEPAEHDASIVIEGPSKVVTGVENVFTVKVNEIKDERNDVKVYVDDSEVYSGRYDRPIEIKKIFSGNTHVIKAVVESPDDYFEENNEFYKTVTVYDKPKVLFISKASSPLLSLYTPFYTVDVQQDIPTDLKNYYAVILNNINAADLEDSDIDRLESYVVDGNGLFVIGGKESYDWGDYNTSLISSLLPVQVGKANKKQDVTNIAILLDTGFSATGNLSGGISFFDVQKSLTADILRSLNSNNKVAVLEANYNLNKISGLSEIGPKREQLINDVGRLVPQGLSELRFAYKQAHDMLRLSKGSKNIVIITDGKLIPQDQAITLEYVSSAYNDGIRTFIVGVGESADEEFLMAIKERGRGEYFRTDEKDRINLYFGDPKANTGELKLVVYDSNHFITEDLSELGVVYGFNSVYPKSTARLLATTSKGDPALTVWNYGLGRVAALTTDDGSLWVPELLGKENSKMLIKTLNWLIEDPERKNPLIMEVPELRLGEDNQITVRSKNIPQSGSLVFYEVDTGLYKGTYFPNTTGVDTVLNTPVAVNYKKEYLNLGYNKDLQKAIEVTNGEILKNDEEVIVDRITSASQVDTISKVSLSWIFLIIAAGFYLIELFIRRIFELKMRQ